MAEGEPWLRWADLRLDGPRFAEAVVSMAAVLCKYRDEWADAVVEAPPDGLLAMARSAVEQRRSLLADGASLAEAAVEMALEGELRRLAGVVVPRLPIDDWRRPTCPFCGSAPAPALLEPSVAGATCSAGGVSPAGPSAGRGAPSAATMPISGTTALTTQPIACASVLFAKIA